MLKHIKSLYLIQKIFFYINDKSKFKLIKYNKTLQKKACINNITYKIFSGRHIIYETKRKGKEYEILTKNLIYEGEYLNSERNGKGKEFNYLGKLKFEGEYLNGKKWKGKGYGPDGNIIYVLKNGKGYVKEYDNYKLLFKGNYLNGERNGKGKEYDNYGNLIFIGEYLNGKKWKGKGYDLNKKKIYELKDGNGNVKEYNEHGKIFEGKYINGEKIGKGKEYYPDLNDLLCDSCILCMGRNKNYKDRLKYEGEYKNEKRNGKGKEYDHDGKLIFEGEY